MGDIRRRENLPLERTSTAGSEDHERGFEFIDLECVS